MPIKLIPPSDRSSNYTVRGTYLPRTPHSFKVDRSLGTPERKEADKLFAQLKADLLSGALSKSKAKKTQERTFSEAVLDYKIGGGENRFLDAIVAHFKDAPLSKIDQAAIDACASSLYPDAPASTRNRQVYTPIAAVLHRENIKIELKRPKGSRGASRLHWLQPEQLFALLDAAEAVNERFGALLTFLAYCGPRLSEALRLEWADVDLPACHAFLRKTKNSEPQSVHLPPAVVASLANMPRAGGRVFGYAKSGRLYTHFGTAARAAGVVIPDGVSFHLLRHTYGALMRRYGGLDTSGLVGTGRWKSRQAAQIYEHVNTGEVAKRADLLPTRGVKRA